jgi:hypothetical protein
VRSYESVVHDELLERFSAWNGMRATGATLLDYLSNEGTLEAAIAFAALFWPAIVEDEGLVILAKFYRPEQLPELRSRFANDPSRIERWVNAWALADYFRKQQFAGDPILDEDDALRAFGHALQLFWSLRLQALFPTRQFIVEVGDDLEGEDGPTITFYEVPADVS